MEKCGICGSSLTSYFEKENAKSYKISDKEYLVCLICQKKLSEDSVIIERLKEYQIQSEKEITEQTKKMEVYKNFVLSTTAQIEGKVIKDYLGIVGAQTIEGINMFKDIFGGIRNIVGGRSKALQDAMKKMRETALEELKEEAFKLGANAVVGIKIDFDEYSEGMIMLSVSGTAVKLNE